MLFWAVVCAQVDAEPLQLSSDSDAPSSFWPWLLLAAQWCRWGSGKAPVQPCGVLGCRRGLGGGTWGHGTRYFVSIHGLSEFSHLYGSVLTFPSADGGLRVCSEAAQARTARVGRNPWV